MTPMTPTTTTDDGFDAHLGGAWREFRGWFADRLLELDDGHGLDVLDVDVTAGRPPQQGHGRFTTVAAREGETFVLSVCDQSQGLPCAGDPDRLATGLRGRGLLPRRTRDLCFERRFPRARVDELSSVLVEVLRDELGVVHPLLLDLPGESWQPSTPPSAGADPGVEHPPQLAWPASAEELDRLLDVTLLPLVGDLPERDEDGDVPIRCGDELVWVAGRADGRRLQLLAFLAEGVADDEAGVAEANRINGDLDVVKARYAHGTLQVVVDLPTEPFSAAVVQHQVAVFCRFVETTAPAVARRLGTLAREQDDGEQDDGEQDDGERTDRARRLLHQLEGVEPGGLLGPADVATVCGEDADVVLGLAEQAEATLARWCAQRDEAAGRRHDPDPDDDLAVLGAECAAAMARLRVLRQALRHLVLR